MVYRVYVEKRPEVATEPQELENTVRGLLGIKSLTGVRVLNRYDVEGISEELFEKCIGSVFSEPQVDTVLRDLSEDLDEDDKVFVTEALPGQFDQRADSAAQCIQIISHGDRPTVRYGKVYVLKGGLTDEEVNAVKNHVINPIDSTESPLEIPDTLEIKHNEPADVAVLEGFTDLDDKGLAGVIDSYGLAMDLADIKTCRYYFAGEHRDPTITEIRVLDTYWSDHCRHTTFNTILDEVEFEDELAQKTYEDYIAVRKELGRTKPVTLMDIGTIAAKYLRANGKLDKLDSSEEINACTVKIKAKIDGEEQDWLLLFKNETHNHPTEIEPFGGAATCIGGAIRDPLSGRAYVYNAMRITGAGDPLTPLSETREGKLPQRKIVTEAAEGYSSYGNQIGVSTGLVDEIYHEGYVAKHLELGAVVGATPEKDVVRKKPEPGDVVILLGGRTGRDGCGGATGSSKSQDVTSLTTAGAEVQKGNAPEERKLQRLFRNSEASRMIKRCNDFGAGGVSVAIGELADGLDINLDVVPVKYNGLDGTELAISESQERMAVVVSADNADKFKALADSENLEATVVAEVTEDPRLVLRWRGNKIVDISRDFLDTDGAEKHEKVTVPAGNYENRIVKGDFEENYKKLAGDLNVCSKRGLAERFDSTIGAGAVLMPFGGKYQLTPEQVMACQISTEKGRSETCSVMSYGFNPFITEKSPYHGAYLAVVESVAKLAAAGVYSDDIYLSFQEFFEKLGHDSRRWGQPMAALLGAFRAQKELGFAAIGGKDSMSGSYEDIDVPPTLVSFAITAADDSRVVSSDFKAGGHDVVILRPELGSDGLPTASSLKKNFAIINRLCDNGIVSAAYTPTYGGIAEAVMKMCFGNKLGFRFSDSVSTEDIFGYSYGSLIIELNSGKAAAEKVAGTELEELGKTEEKAAIELNSTSVNIDDLLEIYESKLEPVYHCNIDQGDGEIPEIRYDAATEGTGDVNSEAHAHAASILGNAKPKVLIPVFPGTNCEYDAAKAVEGAGAEAEIFVVRNLTSDAIAQSVENFGDAIRNAQMIFIPGGFSGGDEPDGSGKFITSFFRNERIKEETMNLLNKRDGLMVGICNGFQALIKLGLVPYGEIRDMDEHCPTLTFNKIGRHQSRLVNVKVVSNKSPWLSKAELGGVYTIPISHGEGRFTADDELIKKLIANGQVATQYVDLDGRPTSDIHFNPNGSAYAIEGITSPDGRVFGKMGHSERIGTGLYRNVPGDNDMKMFESAVEYFRK